MNSDSSSEIRIKSGSSAEETATRQAFFERFAECPIPSTEFLTQLGLFISRQTLSRILFMHDLYTRIIQVHGVIMEFGVRWGQNLALFSSFRGIYEPYNHNRKIVGFDTFSGFPSVAPEDGTDPAVVPGAYGVTEEYQSYLEMVLRYHEAESPLSHLTRFELVVGDATRTLPTYLTDHPETMIAFAYFDLDLYEPTKTCLEMIRDRVTQGTIIGFDELNSSTFPGETAALKDVLGLGRYPIRRSPLDPSASYLVVE